MKNLHASLHAVFSEVGNVAKQKVRGLNYAVLSEAAVLAEIKPLFSKHGLHFGPVAVDVAELSERTTAKGVPINHVVLLVTYRLWHADSGESETFQVAGEAFDSSDKSVAKAMTIAGKYFLRQLLMLETGDDPDLQRTETKAVSVAVATPPAPVSAPMASTNGIAKTSEQDIARLRNLILATPDPDKCERAIVERRKLFSIDDLPAKDFPDVYAKLENLVSSESLCGASDAETKN